MASWDNLFSGHDKEVYDKAGYGRRIGFGKQPALLIIDVTYPFVGDKPEPVLESIKRFPQSCGESGWNAVKSIATLLPVAREKKIPIFYVDREYTRLIRKWNRLDMAAPDMGQAKRGHNIVKEIAPIKGETIIYKEGASAFFATPLMCLLNELSIDTLLIGGGTTSGCVRASVIDAAQYNFRVSVVEECLFDRIELSHKVNLFDMNAKYADVISLAEAKKYLASL